MEKEDMINEIKQIRNMLRTANCVLRRIESEITNLTE